MNQKTKTRSTLTPSASFEHPRNGTTLRSRAISETVNLNTEDDNGPITPPTRGIKPTRKSAP